MKQSLPKAELDQSRQSRVCSDFLTKGHHRSSGLMACDFPQKCAKSCLDCAFQENKNTPSIRFPNWSLTSKRVRIVFSGAFYVEEASMSLTPSGLLVWTQDKATKMTFSPGHRLKELSSSLSPLLSDCTDNLLIQR